MQRVTRMLLTAEQRVLKRILDIAVAVIALIILSPVMLITAVMIKLDSKGPVLYSQERVGIYVQKISYRIAPRAPVNKAPVLYCPALS